jgi:hypothetical protein
MHFVTRNNDLPFRPIYSYYLLVSNPPKLATMHMTRIKEKHFFASLLSNAIQEEKGIKRVRLKEQML